MRLLADSRPRPFALKDKLHFPLQRRQAASAGGVEEGSLLHHPISLALVSFGSKFRFPLPPPLLPFILLAALESSKVHMIESTFPSSYVEHYLSSGVLGSKMIPIVYRRSCCCCSIFIRILCILICFQCWIAASTL